MTKHRSKEEWIAEILGAAADEIDENGYSSFTMESLVRRTDLSKGGIYRFFSNRSDVALAVFSAGYRAYVDFDVADAVSWNLPVNETVFRLVNRESLSEDLIRKGDRIWVRLMPEVLGDKRFEKERQRLLSSLQSKFLELFKEIAGRDGFELPNDFDERFQGAFWTGVGLLEGFAVQTALGKPRDSQAFLLKHFVDLIMSSVFT